ncbi:MAG: 4Fe-4S dicluster domain-containing protein [Methanobacteriota archaeon]|nr:MAG: 4Fe-4S dicluster domain-containing protein [Euryarchaeota archaeon]
MRTEHGNVAPVLLAKGDGPGELRADVPYQMAMILSRVYPHVPEGRIAVVARRCDEKAIAELSKRDIVDRDRIALIGLACTKEQVAECRCRDPCPETVDLGECSDPVVEDPVVEKVRSMPPEARLAFWTDQFRKCNKCYGCTVNCPVCFCDDCLLEDKTFTVEKGIPPGMAFHVIRSMHLADKCVECGECERSCPVDIPLLALRKMANDDMKELFGYTAGDADRKSPLLTTLEGDPIKEGDVDAC